MILKNGKRQKKIIITTCVANPSWFTDALARECITFLGSILAAGAFLAIWISLVVFSALLALLSGVPRFTDAASCDGMTTTRSHFAAVTFVALFIECISEVATGAVLALITLKSEIVKR